MPITPTNVPKNSITPTSDRKTGMAFWDDSVVTWDSAFYAWDSPFYAVSNISKNSITPTNTIKN